MSRITYFSKKQPLWTVISLWSIAILFCVNTTQGDTPNKKITHYSRPGTVITNDPVRSYGLNKREQEILKKESVLITERVAYTSFGEAYYDIYRRDLPVYLTADSILHAVHMSFDHMTMEVETEQLIPRLKIVLNAIIKSISTDKALNDEKQELLIRILVARSLLEENLAREIYHYENILKKAMREEEEDNDEDEKANKNEFSADHWIKDFSFVMAAEVQRRLELLKNYTRDNIRNRDYNMCRPRGHYTKTPALSAYFRALVYLGIDPFIAWADKNDEKNCNVNIKSELRSALVMAHAVRDNKQAFQAYKEMEQITTAIFGKPNGITILELLETEQKLTKVNKELNIDAILTELTSFIKTSRKNSIRFHVSPIPTVGQQSGPAVKPPACISLCPRRQSFDAYAMQSVVNQNIRNRWMASHLDVALVMGSKKAEELLQDEMKKHKGLEDKYSVLKSQYDKEASIIRDYSSGIASEWYMAIGELFREKRLAKKDHLKALTSPSFDTRRLHTFMGAYTEYKHDLVAYSSQANLGGTLCEFPSVFIDPYPELYRRLANFSTAMANVLPDDCLDTKREFYLDCAITFTQLAKIAEKEIAGVTFTEEEKVFLKNLIDIHWPFGSGDISYSGWYAQLYPENDPCKTDLLVADIFSTPNDFIPEEYRNKVLHIGTGPINLGFFELPGPDGKPLIYAGPVYSVYKKLSSNSKRLTDDEWKGVLLEKKLQGYDFRLLFCEGQKTRLSQPDWLQDIINRTNSLEMVRLGRNVAMSMSFPLRLKFSDGDKIVDQIKEASTLKGVHYLKESHSILVAPAGLCDHSNLRAFISLCEREQFNQLYRENRFGGKTKDKEPLSDTIIKLPEAERWKYLSSFPRVFSTELFNVITNGTPDQQVLAFRALQNYKSKWESKDIKNISRFILNTAPSNIVEEARDFYENNIIPDKELLPVLNKLGLWDNQISIDENNYMTLTSADIIPWKKQDRIYYLTEGLVSSRYSPERTCCIPRIWLRSAKSINTDAALSFLESNSGFSNWKYDSKKQVFYAERTCFWGGEKTGHPYGKFACFEKEMLLRLVPFNDILDSEKLPLASDYIPVEPNSVNKYLNNYIKSESAKGLAFAANLLLSNYPNENSGNNSKLKQITKKCLKNPYSRDALFYAADNVSIMNWDDLDSLVLLAFLKSQEPYYELTHLIAQKCKLENYGTFLNSKETVTLPKTYIEYLKSNTDNSLVLLRKIVNNNDSNWSGYARDLAKGIYKAVENESKQKGE